MRYQRNYLYEAYNPEMKMMLKPFLKELGDGFARFGLSVQNLDFETVQLYRPMPFSVMNKEFKTIIAKGTYNICIAALDNGAGVTGFYTDPSSKDFKNKEFISLGDSVSGKYTHIFIARATAAEVDKLRDVRSERSFASRETEFDRRGRELRRKIANAMRFSENRDCKEIKSMASRMGFDFKVYTTNESNGMVDVIATTGPIFKSERNNTFSYSISIVNDTRKAGADEYCKFALSVNTNYYGGIELENSYDVDSFASSMNVCGMMCKKAMELVNFINSFTYGDLYVENE